MLLIAFKINDKQMIKMSEDSEYVRFKNYERKKIEFCDLCRFETEKIMGSKILKSVVLTSIKNILLAVIAIN